MAHEQSLGKAVHPLRFARPEYRRASKVDCRAPGLKAVREHPSFKSKEFAECTALDKSFFSELPVSELPQNRLPD
jgi:hypothetical protein